MRSPRIPDLAPVYARGDMAKVVDLADHLAIEPFDDMLRAIGAVVSASESLALDKPADRALLTDRLTAALGCVHEDGVRVVSRRIRR